MEDELEERGASEYQLGERGASEYELGERGASEYELEERGVIKLLQVTKTGDDTLALTALA